MGDTHAGAHAATMFSYPISTGHRGRMGPHAQSNGYLIRFLLGKPSIVGNRPASGLIRQLAGCETANISHPTYRSHQRDLRSPWSHPLLLC